MTDETSLPADCRSCAFWRKLRDNEGLCCRHAPDASHVSEEVAHWPLTRAWQWCGEGRAAPALSIGSHCACCVFWRRPDAGLNPVNRGDMPMAWWQRAGLCARRAPYPVHEPGPRGFWRATMDMDFCAEGEPRD